MSLSQKQRAEAFDFCARLQLVERPEEALGLLLEGFWSRFGARTVVLLAVVGDQVVATAAVGWDREHSLDPPLHVAEVDRIEDLLEHGGARRVTGSVALAAWGISDAILFALPDGSGVVRNLALVEPSEEREAHAIQQTLPVVEAISPFVVRILQASAVDESARQLDRQRDLLGSIINALPDPVLVVDPNLDILLENSRAEALLSTREEDSEGRRRALEINNLLLSSFLSRTELAGSSGEDQAGRELNLVDPSEGADLLFEVLFTPLELAEISAGSRIIVLRDVTDLKRAAAELEHQFKRVRQAEIKSRRERDRLNLVLENVGDPILVTDDESNIILMNRGAEELFDLPDQSPAPEQHRRSVRENDTKFTSFISDFAISGDQVRASEFGLKNPSNGRTFPVEVVSGKVNNERGEMTAIVSIVHDLTKAAENERLAAELRELNESLEDRIRAATQELETRNEQLEWQSRELERAYRLKSEFLASMSHELRTPINALLGYTSLMRDRIYGDLSDRQDEALDRMYSASQHLLELVNDILDLAKIEAGKMPVHIESVTLATLILELSQTVEPMIRRKNLEFVCEVPKDLPKMWTDRTKVKQVLLNLLSNAVKFTQEGELGIRACQNSDDTIEIEVFDSGIGISPEDRQTIFEDFRQVDQSSTREYGGTGLGLSITKKLLKLLGGTITLESSVGEGTRFYVTLPLRSEEIPLDEDAARRARSADEAVLPQRSGPGCNPR